MKPDSNPKFLRRALLADAAASAATGVILLGDTTAMAGLFGLPAALLHGVGLFTVVYAVLVGSLGGRPMPPAPLVWTVIVGNTLWVAASVALLASGAFAPTALGTAFVIAQAIVVGVLAELQWIGLRRITPSRAMA